MSQRVPGGGGGSGSPHHHGVSSWDDPYDTLETDALSAAEDDTDGQIAYYAQQQQLQQHHGAGTPGAPARASLGMGSLYAATIQHHGGATGTSTARPGAHQVREALPRPTHAQEEQLMYAPRHQHGHRQSRPSPPPPYTATVRPMDARVTGIGVGVPEEDEGEAHDAYFESSQDPYGSSSSTDLHLAAAAATGMGTPGRPQAQTHSSSSSSSRPSVHVAPHTVAAAPPPRRRHYPQRPLPLVKEFKPPPTMQFDPIEPSVTPSPRRSRRYQKTSSRVPDIVEGRKATRRPVSADNHVVACEACLMQWQIPKSAVLLKCSSCQHVSSATPVKLKHLHATADAAAVG